MSAGAGPKNNLLHLRRNNHVSPGPQFPICPKTIRLSTPPQSLIETPSGQTRPQPTIEFGGCLGPRCMAFKQIQVGTNPDGSPTINGACAEGLSTGILDVIAQQLEAMRAIAELDAKARGLYPVAKPVAKGALEAGGPALVPDPNPDIR
jgi:hypothetical protein